MRDDRIRGWALSINWPSRERGWSIALTASALLAAAFSIAPDSARAQSFTWGGTGSTTSTSAYGTATNWSNPPTGAPPVFSTQSAIFGATGSATVTIGAGPMLPDSWTFTSNAQSYTISGNEVDFDVAGATGGLINNANAGQTIAISSNINGSVLGVQVQQLGNSTLVLSGANGYTGGTVISAGTVQVTNANSVGTGTVTLDNGGTFQLQSGTVGFTNNFAINAGGGTIDNHGGVLTISGVISDGTGAGLLTLIGTAVTELSGVNTYTGGTLVNGTTLVVSNNSSVGTGAVTLSNNAIFQADGLSDLTFANNFKLTGSNVIDANGTTLTIAGNISGTGSVEYANGGGPSFHAPGTVVLLGASSYTGGTLICSCTTLQLGDGTHTASIVGDITNEGKLDIVNANTSAITSIDNFGGTTTFRSGTSAGNIAITNEFLGETDFKGNSTAGNATIINVGGFSSGVTTFSNSASAGNANITNQDGSSTVFLGNSSAGNAVITNQSAGLSGFPGTLFGTTHNISLPGLGFFGNSTAGNATIINNGSDGVVAFGFPASYVAGHHLGFSADTATAGNANIVNSNGGNLEFNSFTTAGNATITTLGGSGVAFGDNSTGGNARFITDGTGFVDFTQTIGPNSDHRITAGSIEGSGTYYIGAGNSLVVGSNNLSTTLTGKLADYDPCGCFGGPGPGSLEKVGNGMLTLSGPNTYTGPTTVNGGFLDVESSIAFSSLTTVNAGGALTGAGTVGNTRIATGGIFQPGNGFGTSATVHGTLAFQSGALYLVQINSTSSTFANVTGTASVDGNVGVAIDPSSTVMKKYMILQAGGGVSGAFSGVSTPSNFVGSITYDPTHAYLNLDLNYGAHNNLNVNQQNVANTLSNFFNSNGGISAVLASLTPSGLSQAAGEVATGTQQATFNAMNMFMQLLSDPFVSGRNGGTVTGGGAQPYSEEDGSLAYASRSAGSARDALARMPTKADVARNDPFDNRWSVWGSAFGGGANISGNAALGSNTADTRAFGLAAGADYRITPATIAGFALAGGGTNFSVNSFGSGRSDMFQAGALVRHTVGNAYVTGVLAYGAQDVSTDRTVAATGDHLQANFTTNVWSGRLEGGYRYVTPWMGITPYAAAQFTTLQLPAYAEQVVAGAGLAALSYNSQTVTDSRTEVGLRGDKSYALQNGMFSLRGRLAWAHDFNTDRTAATAFQALPGTFFIVNGAAVAHDSALTTASAEMKWLNGWAAALTFEGEFSDVYNSYAGKGVVRYTW
jgi:autotransporter-associated beta strand protein